MFAKLFVISLGCTVMLASSNSLTAFAWWFNNGDSTPSATANTGSSPSSYQSEPGFPKNAIANFDLDGVKGSLKFSQENSKEATKVNYDLTGLKGNNKLYHVHVRPVPAYEPEKVKTNSSAIAELCADPSTGGHLNPHHITEKLPPKSAPFERYEIGDLSGKHGPMEMVSEDHYSGSYIDDKLPMFGDNSIIGRSIVIHKNDGKRWVCANIVEQ